MLHHSYKDDIPHLLIFQCNRHQNVESKTLAFLLYRALYWDLDKEFASNYPDDSEPSFDEDFLPQIGIRSLSDISSRFSILFRSEVAIEMIQFMFRDSEGSLHELFVATLPDSEICITLIAKSRRLNFPSLKPLEPSVSAVNLVRAVIEKFL